MYHVFIDPDETGEYGLLLIVEAATGVIYQQQCGGNATEQNKVEGFLIPVGSRGDAEKIYDWFWLTFQGGCYRMLEGSPWTTATQDQLKALIAEIYCWYIANDVDERHALQLDESRMDECIEAWIPVITPYGKGILTLRNSD
jgi:hypothetical protein